MTFTTNSDGKTTKKGVWVGDGPISKKKMTSFMNRPSLQYSSAVESTGKAGYSASLQIILVSYTLA